MRHFLAEVCFDIAVNLTDRATEANTPTYKRHLLSRADLWHQRSVFWSGLNTWSQHRERVRSIKAKMEPAEPPVVMSWGSW